MNLSEALTTLKTNGYKYTGKREEMLRILSQEKRYLTAKEVLDMIRNDYPDISFDTIYRNLALFQELRIVEGTELEGERIYRLACGTDDHHHHLICTKCGTTKPIDVCPMNVVLDKSTNFTITGHKFEVYGHCDQCTSDV